MNAISPAMADALATTALTPGHPDAEVIAACGAFSALQVKINAIFARQGSNGITDEEGVAARAPLEQAQDPILSNILASPVAVTPEGVRAVAAALALWDEEILEDGPGDTGQCLTTLLVRGAIGLLGTTEPIGPDAELISLSHQFVRDFATYEAEGDFDAEPGTERAEAARRTQSVALHALSALGNRILALPPTTPAGLAAWAMVMGAWDQDNAAAYDGADVGLSGKLLEVLLKQGHKIGLGVALPDPDAALLALRPEFVQYRAAVYRCDQGADVTWDYEESSSMLLNSICRQIVSMPAAVTAEGRKLQASAALYQMKLMASCSDPAQAGGSEAIVWRYLLLQGGEV